jgi:hypothetical protein
VLLIKDLLAFAVQPLAFPGNKIGGVCSAIVLSWNS